MRSKALVSAVCGMALAAAAAVAGCGGDSEGETDLAKGALPPQSVIDKAKATPLPKNRIKFAAPPKSALDKQ
jgi:hypothetical protein